MTYHIAQLNIAKMLAPIDSDIMHGFASRLDEINALAEQSEGFVWRLKGDDNNATAIRIFEDDMLIINLSVWESIEALHTYTYKTAHAELIKGRKDWFSALGKPHMALWWVKADEIPSTQEAKERLEYLQENGVSPYSFTFAKRFTVDDMLSTHA